jgi:peroxiredoxin
VARTDFSLPDTEGATHSPGGAPATVVVFTCNHCPYAIAWQDRLMAVARDYAPRGVRTLAVNSNDAERYPRDSPKAMAEAVAAGRFGDVPYLYDESQEVARAYDAKVTPDVFVLDAGGEIRYRGAPDADHRDESLAAGWLRDALDAVLAGTEVARPETTPRGCTIKWRP